MLVTIYNENDKPRELDVELGGFWDEDPETGRKYFYPEIESVTFKGRKINFEKMSDEHREVIDEAIIEEIAG